jgi:hypothetical protein
MQAERAGGTGIVQLPPEFNYRDYTIMLLHIGAELEHALMVEYLYAAWSLGGPQVPPEHRERVRGWQEVILGIAKEEMGHLVSVQDLLRLLGGPICLEREDYPWDSDFYPFPFKLEPLTLDALAKYIYAEMPDNWTGPLADEVKARAEQAAGGKPLHRVGELYSTLIQLFSGRDLPGGRPYLADADFQADTYPFQATWDEWGRGYKGGERGNSGARATAAALEKTPDVLVLPGATRDAAVAALQQIAQQGEAPRPYDDGDGPERSHFARFRAIYVEYREIAKGWSPTRNVPINPRTAIDLNGDGTSHPIPGTTAITHPEAVAWAHLFNVRYRMALTNLAHSFELGAVRMRDDVQTTARGSIINATFGEMYNLRAIASILMQTPLHERGDEVAGPPFEMPYTLDLPADEIDRWRLQRDLYEAADAQIAVLLGEGPRRASPAHRPYLVALREADRQARERVETILNGHKRARR